MTFGEGIPLVFLRNLFVISTRWAICVGTVAHLLLLPTERTALLLLSHLTSVIIALLRVSTLRLRFQAVRLLLALKTGLLAVVGRQLRFLALKAALIVVGCRCHDDGVNRC